MKIKVRYTDIDRLSEEKKITLVKLKKQILELIENDFFYMEDSVNVYESNPEKIDLIIKNLRNDKELFYYYILT